MSNIDLKRKITSRGMLWKRCSDYHIQTINKNNILFNIYPSKQTVYIQGASLGFKYFSEKELLNYLEQKKEIPLSKIEHRKTTYKREKEKLYSRSNICYLCGKKIDSISDASVDHRIPLAKGGSNMFDNLYLAHKECNFKKGDSFLFNTLNN